MKANVLLSGSIGALLLGACAAKPPPPLPVPPKVTENPGLPPPTVTPPPRPVGAWLDQTMVAGNWTWQREGERSVARFALPNGELRLILSCDPARRIVTLRHEGIASAEEPVTITTTTQRRVVTGRTTAQPPYFTDVELAADDRLLDAIAMSRGRFMVEIPAPLGTMIVPAWPELSRVVEDCR
ncbi:MAG: hypothetical protein ACOY7T_14030 [Pseudomonadota bacterium]